MASIAGTARALKARLLDSTDPLDGLLDERLVGDLCKACGHSWRRCFWQPTVVILTFLRQVLLPQCSCRQAVAYTIAATRAAATDDEDACPADDPSAYSQARQRLPLSLLEKLAAQLVSILSQPDQLWRGHRVRVVDGSSVSMPDTPALQQEFPQPTSQAKGCGFPVVRLVAMFCWAGGALLSLITGSLAIGELALFRQMFDQLQSNDLVLADRLFGNYAELAMLRDRRVHAVCRVNAARRIDRRRGTRIGDQDYLFTWTRPKPRPMGLTDEEWSTIPETLTVRIVRVETVNRRGFRKRTIELVTTLLDSTAYPPDSLAELYRQRWLVELHLRSLKTTLGMDVLRCQSPEMVRKEIAMHQIAYNLIRTLMVQAARTHEVDIRHLSFAGTQHRLLAQLPHWNPNTGHTQHAWLHQFLAAIAADKLPNRPDRHEPRAVKRRRKSYPYLVHPRHQARNIAYYDKRYLHAIPSYLATCYFIGRPFRFQPTGQSNGTKKPISRSSRTPLAFSSPFSPMPELLSSSDNASTIHCLSPCFMSPIIGSRMSDCNSLHRLATTSRNSSKYSGFMFCVILFDARRYKSPKE